MTSWWGGGPRTTVVLGVRLPQRPSGSQGEPSSWGSRVVAAWSWQRSSHRLRCGVGPSRVDDCRRNGVGIPGHLPDQHAGHLDGSREAVPIGASGPMMLGSVAVQSTPWCAHMPWAGALWGSILGWIAGSAWVRFPPIFGSESAHQPRERPILNRQNSKRTQRGIKS